MLQERIYQLALCEIPSIGPVHAKQLAGHFGTASAVFGAGMSDLMSVVGIGETAARRILHFRNFDPAKKELDFIRKFSVSMLFLSDPEYPQRLLECYDPPTLLFYKGTAELNRKKMVAVVGTRHHTEYGKNFTEKLVSVLGDNGCTVVSGLAFGIDAIAHRVALKKGIPTIGVTGHGLDTIYPPQHTSLARQMVAEGGLLTEFRSATPPDRHHFPCRNRIVAGMTDATIVIESGIRGGSMITAGIAGGYHREVFAVPGRTTDSRSAGCNRMIVDQQAVLLQDPEQFIELMGWKEEEKLKPLPVQQVLAMIDEEEQQLVDLLSRSGRMSVDDLTMVLGWTGGTLASVLLHLELKGIIQSLPGRRYRMFA